MQFSREDFEDVYATARMAHVGQKRRSGEDYFSHPSEVRNIVRRLYPGDHAAQMVALLHDSLEDAPGSTVQSVDEMEQFIRGSIQDPQAGETIIGAVRALTHEKGGDYSSYVASLISNPLALRVKLADMVHNLSSSPTPKQKAKYANAIAAISDAAGGIPQSISAKHWEQLTGLTESKDERVFRSMIRETLLLQAT